MDESQTPKSIPSSDFALEDPRQIEVYNYLKRLVGDGAASFYKDACRLMVTKPPFEATTHLVSHALREVDVSLLGILEGITESIPKGTKDRHKRQIKIILKALDIKEDSPLAEMWLDMINGGLHSTAHRSSLAHVRPFDDEFQKKWETMNLILYGVLEKFESKYIKVFESLDDLAKKTTPSKEDIKKLEENIPNNRVAHERFFSSITVPAWLPLLESSGFFTTPPAPEQDLESGGTRHLNWPILIYLYKVAQDSPELVTKILTEVPDTDNGRVNADLIEIATRLPKEQRKELIPHVKRWMNPAGRFFGALKYIEMIESLAADDEVEAALDLSGELLGFVPDSTPPIVMEETGWTFPRDPKPKIDQWQYARFLEDNFPSIAQKNPICALELLGDLLNDFYDLKRGEKEEQPPQDYSYVGRPSIETNDYLHRDDPDDSLISAMLSISIAAIENDNNCFRDVIEELESRKWPVFQRVALYLLSKYPTLCPDLVVEDLTDLNLMDDSNFDHEYALLADSGFSLLTDDQKKDIFDFIAEAKAKRERVKDYPDVTEDYANRMVKMWQRDQLSMFDAHLVGDHKLYYESLIAEFGDAENPRFHKERSRVFTGPVSDVNAEKIKQMLDAEIIELLKTWQPKKGKYDFGPSIEGLGRELGMAVKSDPARFSLLAAAFTGLDPTYVRNYLQAFSEAAQNNIPFEWGPIVDLGIWIIEQPREIEGRVVLDVFDDDANWQWTRRALISLISTGLNNNTIPYELHEKVWRIIETLSNDPHPTPEDELTREGEIRDDAYGLTINSVRGEAMTTVVEYGLWMDRLVEKLPTDQQPPIRGFELMPNIKEVLDAHLSDPSIAIRAVYGRYLPWIMHLDRDWVIINIEKIFPKGGFGTPLYDAAWETYIGYVQPYNDVFDVLKEQYLEAIKNMGLKEKKKTYTPDIDNRLVEHLMTQFWRGKLDTEDPEGLFMTFWNTAGDDLRAHALDFIGRSVKNTDGPLEDEVFRLLKMLWEIRIGEAEAAADKKSYEKEIAAFGWWFASGKFDEDWSIKEFLRSLEISKKTKGDYFVLDRLDILVETRPVEAISILQKMVKRDTQQWVLFGNESDMKSILNKALNSSEEDAKTVASALINGLISLGYTNYSDLLLPSTPPEPTL